MNSEYIAEIAQREQAAIDLFTKFISENRDELHLVSRWGDGSCGELIRILREELGGK